MVVEERVYVQRQPGLHILSALFVSLIVIVVALWAMGVITFAHPGGGPVVITIDFSKAEQASERAVDKTGQALEKAGEKLQRKAHEPASPPPPVNETAPVNEPPAGQVP